MQRNFLSKEYFPKLKQKAQFKKSSFYIFAQKHSVTQKDILYVYKVVKQKVRRCLSGKAANFVQDYVMTFWSKIKCN